MTWEDILFEYEEALDFIKRQSKYRTQEFVCGMYAMLRSIFRRAKIFCKDFPSIDISNFTFSYRGNSYKIEFDDAGQQMILIAGDRRLGGGAFEPHPEKDWSELIDDILDCEISSLKSVKVVDKD